ncbi:DEAD/DEAH box helicase [Curtobacterium sp. S6]|uniref:DEAD/DEAH box helicase n=1 Tax=Curtobacterium sp. S6 TaxID=1479623 RepID=UPI0004AA0D52
MNETSKTETTVLEETPEAVQELIDAEAPVAEEIQPEEDKTFADFGVRQDICDALAANGITHPFPIQSLTLPVALSGQDIIGQAKTGTGKTLGFGLPVLQRVAGRDDDAWGKLKSPGAPQALIVVPTRELAVQVGSDLSAAAKQRNARVATIYGGRAYEPQIAELEKGVEVVVGTPGRLIDLHRQKILNLSQVGAVVLDEADEMLDLGFLPDVERLLSAVPEVRQTMLFSATMPGPVIAMARRYMSHPMHIRANAPDDEGATKKDIRQVIYRAHPMDKDELIARSLQAEGRGRTIIFTKTKRAAARLSDELIKRGFAAASIHGDLGQGAREQALRAFRNDKVDVLVATDVAARGIDVTDVTHVVNFQCPEDEKIYLHRIGRTGRAGNKGTAITLVDWEDVPRWSLINKALDLGVPEPVETYSSSPHLYADLNIPAGTKGKLPKDQRKHAGLAAEEVEDIDGDSRSSRSGKGEGRGGSQNGRGRSGGGRGRERSSDSRPRSGRRSGDNASDSKASGQGNNAPADESASQTPRRRRRRRSGGNGQSASQQ